SMAGLTRLAYLRVIFDNTVGIANLKMVMVTTYKYNKPVVKIYAFLRPMYQPAKKMRIQLASTSKPPKIHQPSLFSVNMRVMAGFSSPLTSRTNCSEALSLFLSDTLIVTV